MRIIEALKGLSTEATEDGIVIRTKDKHEAWNLRNKLEMTGYHVSMERNKQKYTIKVHGMQLQEAYLLRNKHGTAI